MKEFFRGWRRKIGCGLLLLACALIAPWTRSFSTADVIDVPRPYLQHVVESIGGSLHWTTHSVSKSQWKYAAHSAETPHYARRLEESGLIDVPVWTVPYWGLVLPLTVVAAALIVWPSRRHRPQATTLPRFRLLHGWRRKLTCITLVVTCGLLAMWVQSHIQPTVIDINNSQSLLLQDGSLRWATDDGYEGNPSTIHDWFDTLNNHPQPNSQRLLYHWKQRWHHGWPAVGWGFDTTGSIGVHWWQLHYWTIVPLLICLSAWLLFSPRMKSATIAPDSRQ